MVEKLRHYLDGQFFYGPVSREQAFSVPVTSWATELDSKWYIGTNEQVESLAGVYLGERPAPVAE
jgi:hypothetical protein